MPYFIVFMLEGAFEKNTLTVEFVNVCDEVLTRCRMERRFPLSIST